MDFTGLPLALVEAVVGWLVALLFGDALLGLVDDIFAGA
jgi:hypothetical protein